MVNRKALWQDLRMYDGGGKLLNEIKSLYVNSLACVRVKGGESECFWINSGMRKGCIMSPWLFNVYVGAMMEEVKMGMGGEEREWRLPVWRVGGRETVGRFVDVCITRCLKVNAGKSKVMM